MTKLIAIPGKQYYLSCYRVGFGNYWCKIEILEVVPKEIQNHFKPAVLEYSIKYRKLSSAYDEYYEQYSDTPTKSDVWVHHEWPESWNRRILEEKI